MNFSRIPLLVWFLVPTLVIIGLGTWFLSTSSLFENKSQEGEVLPAAVSKSVEGVEEFEIIGREHIAQGTAGSGYNSNPPTSGPHWGAPATNGIHDEQLADEQTIHNLEHGHIWITYKPDISDEDRQKLAEIAKSDDWKVLISKRETNSNPIILVAWGRLLRLNEFNEAKIKDFIKTYRNRGPEKTPD